MQTPAFGLKIACLFARLQRRAFTTCQMNQQHYSKTIRLLDSETIKQSGKAKRKTKLFIW